MLEESTKAANDDAERKQTLLGAIPSALVEGRLDLDVLRRVLQDLHVEVSEKERYQFSWEGKADSIHALNSPPKAILEARKEYSIDFSKSNNVFIEGDNLEVLKILQTTLQQKVKMIYIDPPYNANSSQQLYRDDFRETRGSFPSTDIPSERKKLKSTEDRVSEVQGRLHSQWLSMMYPRLFLARKLLKEDGLMFVSIDDTEVHNLRLLMNEIFGERNIEVMIWRKVGSNEGKLKLVKRFRIEHEYILVGYKNKEKTRFKKVSEFPHFRNPVENADDDPRGDWVSGNMSSTEEISVKGGKNYYAVISPGGRKFVRQWKFPKSEFERLNRENRIYWGKEGRNVPRLKVFASEPREIYMPSIIEDKGTAKSAASEMIKLFGFDIFPHPKPVKLIQYLIDACQTQNEIVMDFFAGSGTTAHAVLAQNASDGGNRSFVLVQIPEPVNRNYKTPNLAKAEFRTIADITRMRITAALEMVRRSARYGESFDLGMKVFGLKEN